jgi:acyl-CoA thioesterase YciA
VELISTTTCLTKHIGVNGNMFGGEVMSLIDISAAAYASEVCRYPRLVTLKVTETLFKKPIKVGHIIKVYGEVKRVGTTSITIKIEVRSHNVRTSEQQVVCETEITFVKIDEDGNSIPINPAIKEKYEKE